MKNTLLLFLLLTLVSPLEAIPLDRLSGKYVRFYKPSEYKSDAQVWGIAHGEEDDMFFATNEGVVLFDGVRWEKYMAPSECIMRSVFYDTEEKILYSGGVNEFGSWHFDAYGQLQYTCLYQNPRNLATKEFWRVVKVPYSHLIYFQSPVSVQVYDTQTGEVTEVDAGGQRFNALSSVNEKVYVQQENVLYRLDGTQKTMVTDGLQGIYLLNMFPETGGRIRLVSSEKGTIILDHTGAIQQHIPVEGDMRITSICRMQDRYLIGTGNSGFYVKDLQGNILSHVNESQGLKNVVLSVGYNNRGDLWLGLNGGIMYVEESVKEESFLMDPKENIGYVYCGLRTPGALYAGTNKGLYKVTSAKDQPRFEMIPSLKGQVWNLYQVGDQVVVAHDKGLFTLTGGQFQQIRQGGVYTLLPIPSRPGWYISGNYNGFSVYQSVQGVLRFRHHVEGYNNLVQEFAFDKEGNLWLVHSRKGFRRLRFDADYTRIEDSGIYEFTTPGMTRSLMVQVEQDLIFLDNEGGVYKYNELQDMLQEDAYYTSLLEPVSRDALSLQYIDGLFWQVHEDGVGFLRKDYNRLSVFPHFFSHVSDQFIPKGFRKIIPLEQDRYAFGLLNGMGMICTDRLEPRLYRMPQIRRVEAVGQTSVLALAPDTKGVCEVPPFYHTLCLRLASLERNGQVEYRIPKRGEKWEATSEGQIFLTYLTPGNYTIEIRACDGYGSCSEVNTLSLTVKAPWYATRLALFLYLLCILAIAYAFHLFYKRKVQQKEKQIKAEQEQKRKEEMSLFQLNSLRGELENKNSKLMSITMLGVQNNTFLKKTKEDISELLSDDMLGAHKMQIKRIVREIDKQLNDQSGWNNFAEHFNNTCNGFFDKLNERHPKLTNNDLRLCAYIRINLSAKEIASLMNISTNSVEMARYRLRKKLDLDEEVTLSQYLTEVISDLEIFGETDNCQL
ncbi:MAG: hypothetical protein LIP08_14085 [Bacteroides sp.]|nr:hypothetical protein [Bacteroides sp.]